MSVPTEYEILREARRVLRKLAEPRSTLVPNGHRRWEVRNHCGAESGRTKTSAAMVGEFHKRDWIAPLSQANRAMVLTREGRAIADSDIPDGFAARHQFLALRRVRSDSGEETTAVVNDAESPLGWLRVRRQIDATQFEAGERLRRDYTMAQLEPRLGLDFSVAVLGIVGAENAGLMTDAVLAAKQRFSRAMSAVGPELSDLLFDICCALRGLEAIETANDWPRRSGKVVLRLALDRLASHYGIGKTNFGSAIRALSPKAIERKELIAC